MRNGNVRRPASHGDRAGALSRNDFTLISYKMWQSGVGGGI